MLINLSFNLLSVVDRVGFTDDKKIYYEIQD